MRQLTQAELKELHHIEQCLNRLQDWSVVKNTLSIVIPLTKKDMWLNILELAQAKSTEVESEKDSV